MNAKKLFSLALLLVAIVTLVNLVFFNHGLLWYVLDVIFILIPFTYWFIIRKKVCWPPLALLLVPVPILIYQIVISDSVSLLLLEIVDVYIILVYVYLGSVMSVTGMNK